MEDSARSTLAMVILVILAVFAATCIITFAGCGSRPLAAAETGTRYQVIPQIVGGVEGCAVRDTATGRDYVVHFHGNSAAIMPVIADRKA